MKIHSIPPERTDEQLLAAIREHWVLFMAPDLWAVALRVFAPEDQARLNRLREQVQQEQSK